MCVYLGNFGHAVSLVDLGVHSNECDAGQQCHHQHAYTLQEEEEEEEGGKREEAE